MSRVDNMNQHLSPGAWAALALAKKAGVAVTVDCQCDGIFIGGHQYAGGRFCTDIGAPIYVPSEVIAAIIEHAIELEPFLRAYGQFSCGCEYPDDDSNFRDLPTEH
jgi:hypothetical protein